MMNKLVIRLILVLYKIKRRNLFMIGAVATTLGFILQITLVSFPLFNFLPSPLVINIRSSKHLLSLPSKSTLSLSNVMRSSSLYVIDINERHQSVEEGGSTINGTIPRTKRRQGRKKRRRRKKNREEEDELEAEIILPSPQTPLTPLQRHIRSLSPNEALLYAKRELQMAPVITNESDLYAPIFNNISMFKRSYELMELVLKVYIYPDGEGPIFHEPHLSGIYASEGWFMRFMEGNQQFVTRDPEKANLFYLPYSARQLQQALYVEGSHNLSPLSHFMRDYVNSIAAKYPFWNRTHGADHFLVACHDWGPYTLKEHKELAKNSIKVLCNADLSEGVFKAEHDVSLPETTIKRPRSPHRSVGGGRRVSQRPILAFYAGNLHGRVRPLLVKHWHNNKNSKDNTNIMHIYDSPLPDSVANKMTYIEHMKSSKFCICPMGYEVNSPRIVEAIYYECIPVIIADNFVPPLNDVLDWTAFSVIVFEEDIPNLKKILLAIPLRRYLKMLANLKMLQRHFLWNLRPLKYDLFHMILHSIWLTRLNQLE